MWIKVEIAFRYILCVPADSPEPTCICIRVSCGLYTFGAATRQLPINSPLQWHHNVKTRSINRYHVTLLLQMFSKYFHVEHYFPNVRKQHVLAYLSAGVCAVFMAWARGQQAVNRRGHADTAQTSADRYANTCCFRTPGNSVRLENQFSNQLR
jgi:hypothetical protein